MQNKCLLWNSFTFKLCLGNGRKLLKTLVHCPVYSVHLTVYNEQRTVYSVQCTVCQYSTQVLMLRYGEALLCMLDYSPVFRFIHEAASPVNAQTLRLNYPITFIKGLNYKISFDRDSCFGQTYHCNESRGCLQSARGFAQLC